MTGALIPIAFGIAAGFAIAGLVAWFTLRYDAYDPMQIIFAMVMLVGGAVILIASFHASGMLLPTATSVSVSGSSKKSW